MRQTLKRGVSLVLALAMVFSIVATMPFTAIAANDYTINSTTSTDNYYNLISKKDYDIAPGITESEIVLNNDSGSRRQVLFVMEADLNNEYVKVINSYNGMIPEYGEFKTGIMSQQAAWAEANGYGNVVGAMNTCLSWYNTAPYAADPNRVGEPLGFIMLDAEVLFDPTNCGYDYGNVGFPSVLVINKDFDENGNPRPADIPKVEMPQIRSAADLDGWEDQVIPVSSGYIVKDGVNQAKTPNHSDDNSNSAPRSVVGIKPDGTVVIMLNDGRQSPYSAGMSMYELAEVMLDLGCSYAVNCDGGGSSTYLSERPGEELKVQNSPSDGAERPTTQGIFFITTAPATGEFARANITTDATHYTPGSTVKFSALGTDLVGTEAEIPADVSWQLADSSMGTIEDGVFVSNGKVGTATAQMVWNGEVVGEASIEIVVPTNLTFSQAVMTVPFNKEVVISLNATIDGLLPVVLKPEDIKLETTNEALGTFDGFNFTSVSEENAPANLTSTLKATLVHNTSLVATASLSLGKGSEVLFNFENPSDIDEWNIADVNGNDKGFYQHLSFATSANGQVHDGLGSMRVEMNPISAPNISSGGYAQSDLYLDHGIVVENAKSIGFWAYIPDEYEHCWIRVLYWYDSNGDGKFESKNTVNVINQPEVYNSWDESGWKYFSVDVSKYDKILIPGMDCKDKINYNATKNDANNFRFIEFMFPHTNTNDLWKEYGTINGLQTVYVDNITADFSDAVDDREAPIFGNIELLETEKSTALKKYETVTTTSNLISVSASVKENTNKTNATGLNAASAKAYIDGVEVPVTFTNGRMAIADIAVADGIHRVKFEIADNMGNKSVIIRLIEVKSGVDASTVQLVPADPSLDRLLLGSLYWMNVNATAIETIKAVKLVVDLNYGNHWELDNMELAAGFTADYTVDVENNTATIIISRTGNNTDTGAATLASLPIRVIYYDTDIKVEDHDVVKYWNEYAFWLYDLKVDVDMGEITYVDGYSSDVLGAFSNEEFSVDTEIYAPSTSIDPTYKAEKDKLHVHTVVALADKAATCTANGYTGRTFCDVCKSVVDWGTVVPATGHQYKVVDKQLVCECGELNNITGFENVNSDWYYFVEGTAISGWQYIITDDENVTGYYYFSEIDCKAVDGDQVIGGYSYKFEEHKLVRGQLVKSNGVIKYMWAGKWLSNSWATIDGEKYYFSSGVAKIGPSTIRGEDGVFAFDSNGVWLEGRTGLMEIGGRTYYYENGKCRAAGLVKVGDDFYYINANYQITTGRWWVGKPNTAITGMTEGEYEFGEDGKLIRKIEEFKIVGDYIYIGGVKQLAYQLIECEGAYYFINSGNKIAKNITLYLSNKFVDGHAYADGTPLTEGYYAFDAEGKMVIQNGIIGNYLYINNVRQTSYKLINYEGTYYFINDGHKIAKNITLYLSNKFVDGHAYADGTPLTEGYYAFDAEGKMVIQNGIIGNYLYINNVRQTSYKLINYEGTYYFINDGHKIAKNITLYLSNKFVDGHAYADGTPLTEGYYAFDAEGKMVIQNGIIGNYLYINNVRQTSYKLINYEGAYYFINDGHKIAKNITLYLSNKFVDGHAYADGTPLTEGYYAFDAEGKMVIQNGIIGNYLYINNVRQTSYKLINFEGFYYFINSGNKIAKNITLYLSNKFVDGHAYADGTPLTEGYYTFDAEGKMIIKDGIIGDYFYKNNVQQKAYQLVKYDGNFYFIDAGNKIAKNRTIDLLDRYVYEFGLPAGKYSFDAEGKMILKNGPADGKFYINGVVQNAYQLVEFEGYYYFIGDGHRIVKNCTIYLNNEFIYITGLPAGYYSFDSEGRLILN